MTAIVDGSLGFTAPVGAVYNGLQTVKEQAQATAKASALAKLTALGLSEDEVKALVG